MRFGAILRVFAQPRYSAFFLMAAFAVASAAILLPSASIVWQVITSDAFSFSETMQFLFALYGSLGTNTTLFSGVLTVTLSLLFAFDLTLMVYYIRRRQVVMSDKKAHLAGIGGVISGVFGIGCAACGSVILSTFAGIFGGVGMLALLPLHGAEFGLIGVLLLLFTGIYVMRRIDDPIVCPLES